MKLKVKIRERHYPGYGTPPEWTVEAIHDNRQLEIVTCSSEYAQGAASYKLRDKWDKEWDDKKFNKLLNTKPLASPWCSICGKDTLEGSALCVEKIFCNNCAHLIPQYQAEWREQERKRNL